MDLVSILVSPCCRYGALCEAVDQMCDVSTTLCQAMGLPIREFSQKEEGGNGDKQGETDGLAPSQPASPGKVQYRNSCGHILSVRVFCFNQLMVRIKKVERIQKRQNLEKIL